MSLSDSIKILRQKSFLSQSAFAEELHVATTTVNRWETNKAKPNLSAMKAIKGFCEKNALPYDEIEREWLGYSLEEEEN